MSRPFRMFAATGGSAVLLAGMLAGCSIVDGSQQLVEDAIEESSSSETVEAPEGDILWSYMGDSGPAAWGDLSAEYASCATGQTQSPIDLPATASAAAGTASVSLLEPVSAGEAEDTGRTGEFDPDHDTETISFDGVDYSLDQIHYHVPAEHTVDGKVFDAEFHFVHASADDDKLVLSLLAEEGDVTAAIQPFIENATAGEDRETAFDLGAILPADSASYVYDGSLTTPPCTKGVQWVVLQDTITLSADQLTQLEDLHGANARPVQPLGDREVAIGDVTVTR